MVVPRVNRYLERMTSTLSTSSASCSTGASFASRSTDVSPSPVTASHSTDASPSPVTASRSSLRKKALVAAAILAAFSAYSLWVIDGYGYTGFLSLAAREPWGLQMLLDLVLACSFAMGWMVQDARKHSIRTWPFLIATLFLGSVGLLGYVVWRGFTTSGATRATSATA